LEDAREQLASRSGSWLRFLSKEWRTANRTVRAQLSNPKLPGDQMLAVLDELLDGQAALRRVQECDEQGVEAFGSNWERDRSNSAYMRGVVAWMRTLRPLGVGVREQLADISDRSLAVELAARLRPQIERIQKALAPVHDALLIENKNLWSDDTSLQSLSLSRIAARTASFAMAWDESQHLVGGDQLTVLQARDRIALLEQEQAARVQFGQMEVVGQAAFGQMWRSIGSDVEVLRGVLAWMHGHGELRFLAATLHDPIAKKAEAQSRLAEGQVLARELATLFATLAFSGSQSVDAQPLKSSVVALTQQLRSWEANPEGLPQWVAYLARVKLAQRQGLAAFVKVLDEGALDPERVRGAFDLAYFEAVLAAMVERDRALGQFDGKRHTELVESFVALDRERINLARHQVVQVHRANIPQRGGAAGPTAVLMGEMAKKKAHLPIRLLMERAAPAIQALKPVFMMSPLSVAQFLPQGAVGFDLLVVDEASQVQPIDALGAIARAKQIVVVGDERQLPPTRFFAKALGDGSEGQDDDGAQPADVESILGLCRARGLPERMLKWHYRSRHQSLIAVSNREFYDNKLFIVPSPYTGEAGVGLRFHHLPDAVYDRGNTRTNPKEAKTVARAVIAHAQTTPNLTLGVATFSTQQRRAVFDEIELLRRQHPETEGFFAAHAHEPFFVKSLENIQGDERDVILISIGYGRDAHGNVSMNFGPVSNEGGERRLNVLISRAKSRCEVFSSITDEDIDLERGRGKGTAALKLFMHYARTGRMHIVADKDQSKEDVFEQEVAAALRARGYDLHTNVGVAGFFVSIAIANPDKPGRYVLGIECDGRSYRDAKSARDRDRLREQALRDKGWIVHRVWSSEWFRRPAAELDALVAVIEAAKAEPDPLDTEAVSRSRAVPVDFESTEHDDYVEVGLVAAEAAPAQAYVEASFPVPKQYELHLLPATRMAAIVRDVVHIEGPIHRSEIVARIRTLWDLQRAGGRIQAAVDEGINYAVSERMVSREGDFLLWPDREVIVRDRSEVVSTTLRRPELLPPMEIDAAIQDLVRENLGATLDETALHVSRRLGYRTTSAQLRAALIARAEALVAKGVLELRGAVLAPLSPA
jgi:very-short-patch-repair endonuclease